MQYKKFSLLIAMRQGGMLISSGLHLAAVEEYEGEVNATKGLVDTRQRDIPSKELLETLDKSDRTWQTGNFSHHLFTKANLMISSNPLN
jgi:hypothetical protein